MFFFCLSSFCTSSICFLDDRMIQSKGGWGRVAEKKRMEKESMQGGGEVILESLNCNHHLQLLPPRCSNWTSTEGGREKVKK